MNIHDRGTVYIASAHGDQPRPVMTSATLRIRLSC